MASKEDLHRSPHVVVCRLTGGCSTPQTCDAQGACRPLGYGCSTPVSKSPIPEVYRTAPAN